MILPQGCCNRRILFIPLHCSPSKILFSTYFKLPLIKSDSVSFQQRNLQLLLTVIYKTINNLNSFFMAEVFVTNVLPYNLRGSTNLVLPKARTNLYGIDTVRIFGQKLWQTLPKEVNESQTLEIFKRNIKSHTSSLQLQIMQAFYCKFRIFIRILLMYFLYSWHD